MSMWKNVQKTKEEPKVKKITEETLSLAKMAPGEEGTIAGYKEGARDYRRKLLSFGLTRGTAVTVVQKAPLGDPVEIRVRGYRLSLRKAEAEVLELTQDSQFGRKKTEREES